ncbi:MAG: response regulator [Flavobacterium sp.]
MKTIVVIDDDPIYQMLVKKMIDKIEPGQTIINFLNISENIDKIFEVFKNQNNEIIVLLDINLPGIDGWEFLDLLKAKDFEKNNIRIYLVSSSVDKEDQEKSQICPKVIKYYSKPLYMKDFDAILNP